MKDPKTKIIQICPPGTPLFAVYYVGNADSKPQKIEDLELVPCPVVALIEVDGDDPMVAGLIIEPWGLDTPSGDTYLGYTTSIEDAHQYLTSKFTE